MFVLFNQFQLGKEKTLHDFMSKLPILYFYLFSQFYLYWNLFFKDGVVGMTSIILQYYSENKN